MIVRVQMVNCQSWKDSSFTLSKDKLNVIIADNGTGKSVFFKMLKITSHPKYFDRTERKDLIRKGEEFAAIFFQFDDGALACTKVFPTYTLYAYKPIDSETIITSYEPDPRMLRQAGLLSDGSTPFVANIVDSDQDLLLVNSKLKYNFNLVQMLIQNAELETVKDRTKENINKVINPLSSVSSKCEILERAIRDSKYCDTVTRELQLDVAENAEILMYQMIDVINDVIKINKAMQNSVDYDFLMTIEEFVEKMESCKFADLYVGESFDYLDPIVSLVENLETCEFQKLVVEDSPADVENELNLLEKIETIDFTELFVGAEVQDLNREIDLLEALESLQLRDLEVGDPITIETEHIDVLEQLLDLNRSFVLLSSVLMTINSTKEEINAAEQELHKAGTVYDCAIYGKVVYDGKNCIPYCE